MNTGDLNVIYLIGNAGLVVRLVMVILLFFSIMSWTIIFLKLRYIWRAARESDYFAEIFWESRDFTVALNESEDLSGSPLARIFRIGYDELAKVTSSVKRAGGGKESMDGRFTGTENIRRSLRRAIAGETTRMTQMVPFLATTGNTAPFIGLFGTVWGIMNSFHNIGIEGSASLAAVAPGISEALIATAAGLAVAIPAVIGYNYFVQKINDIESEMQSFSADFLNIVEYEMLRTRENPEWRSEETKAE